MKSEKQMDAALLLLRIVCGTTLLYFGVQKVVPVFGGMGFGKTIDAFASQGYQPWLGTIAIAAESLGALGMILGLLSRVAAFGIAATMAVASATQFGALDLFGAATVKEFFLPILIGTIALAVLIAGPGRYSLDAKLFRKKKTAP